MHSSIQYALSEIHLKIPYEMLKLALWQIDRRFHGPIDEEIMAQVIRPHVMLRCNLVGGKYKEIVLKLEYWEPIEIETSSIISNIGPYSIYRIPPEARDNLSLVDVIEVEWPGVQNGYGIPYSGYYAGNSLMNAAKKLLDSHTFRSSPPKPTVEVLTGDLIRLNPSQHNHQQWVLTCKVCYDDEMTNLDSSATLTFGELCLETMKMYIYNKLYIKTDQAFIEAGAELGTVKSLIEEYKGSEERITELVKEFHGSALFDPLLHKKLLFHCLQ